MMYDPDNPLRVRDLLKLVWMLIKLVLLLAGIALILILCVFVPPLGFGILILIGIHSVWGNWKSEQKRRHQEIVNAIKQQTPLPPPPPGPWTKGSS